MWERFTIKKKSVGQIGPDRCRQCEAKWNGRQVATRDAVQEEEEELPLLRRCADLRFKGVLMRQVYFAGKSLD